MKRSERIVSRSGSTDKFHHKFESKEAHGDSLEMLEPVLEYFTKSGTFCSFCKNGRVSVCRESKEACQDQIAETYVSSEVTTSL